MFKKYLPILINLISILSPKLAAKIAIELFSRPQLYNRTPVEQELFIRAKQLTFKSGRIANTWGQENSKIVLLCHGWESRGTAFHVLIEQLLAKNFKVIAWNAPAHGTSLGKTTNLIYMTAALHEDLATENINPDAIVGHSMGGALIGLLHKHQKLPQSITIISAPTNVKLIFDRYFKLIKLSPKASNLVMNKFNSLSQWNLEAISLINSDLYKTTQPLIVHDEDDKEIPFSEFTNLQNNWETANFHATQGLGHRRILRDEALAKEITKHIIKTT